MVCGSTGRPPSIKATVSPPPESSEILYRLATAMTRIVPRLTQTNSAGCQRSDAPLRGSNVAGCGEIGGNEVAMRVAPLRHRDRRNQGQQQVDRQDDGRHRQDEHHHQAPRLPAGVILSVEEIHGHPAQVKETLGASRS